MSENVAPRDPLYLFACYLELRKGTNVAVHRELLAALDDPDPDIRCVAEVLLGRSSPYPEPSDNSAKSGEVAGAVRSDAAKGLAR